MLSLLLFCLMIILTAVESKSKKDKISAQVGNDGSIRNVRSLLQTGSEPNGGLHLRVYHEPVEGECVSFNEGGETLLGKVLSYHTGTNGISIQECQTGECDDCDDDNTNHLDTTSTMTSQVHLDMSGCQWTPDGTQIETEGDDPECEFADEVTHISFTNPDINKTTCDCPLSCHAQDTYWGAYYPIVDTHAMTISLKSDDIKHQIDMAKTIKDETASRTEPHAGRRIIIASFCDAVEVNGDDYFDTKFPSTAGSTDHFLTVIKLSDDGHDIFQLAQKATAKGMFYAEHGFDTITLILCTEKLEQALDTNNGGAHYIEFKKLLDRSGCYGANNNKHTVLLMYHEQNNEITGDEQRRFSPLSHLRFEPLSILGSTNSMSLSSSLSRPVITKYLCGYPTNDQCDSPAAILEDIDVTADSMIGLLEDLGYDTTTFCSNGGWNISEINDACNDDRLTPSNTCGDDGQQVIQNDGDESMCVRLVKYICRREAISDLTASIDTKYSYATGQDLGECPDPDSE